MVDNKNPLVSLIIPTYQREKALVACLQCAIAQTYRPMELLIIDQTENHDESTNVFLDGVRDRLQIIHHQPPSAVTARNCGLNKAQGEILVFIDDDTTFEPGFIEGHVAAHQRGADVVQGRVIEPGRGVSYRSQWVLPWLRIVGSNTYDRTGLTNTLTGCNFSISHVAAKSVGQFDTNFTGVVCREDADYGARCYRAGLHMVFDPVACLTHHRDPVGGVDADVKATERMYELSLLRNELYFARKHFVTPIVWVYKLRMAKRMRRAKRFSDQTQPISIWQLLRQADREAKQLLR